ncbi:MAG: DapH/DapD/GlmU-related protein [Castellaniella sp.]|uniref:DapH/DapD/GlmU-related protein n=1 Tax=Castellaniella sp. TaxID=1955812 RepID=UPI003C707F4B
MGAKKVANLLRPVAKRVLRIWFDEKYISGRHFDIGFSGFIWALRSIWQRNILRLAPPMPWPVALNCHISNSSNIHFHPDNLDNFQSPGAYFQCINAKIFIGRGVYIGPNVGIITANHDFNDLDLHLEGKDVVIKDNCWIGMNSVVLPGVVLEKRTIVGAGSVVTKNFSDGDVVICGVPARVIKSIGGVSD